jgi:hypothetical protein
MLGELVSPGLVGNSVGAIVGIRVGPFVSPSMVGLTVGMGVGTAVGVEVGTGQHAVVTGVEIKPESKTPGLPAESSAKQYTSYSVNGDKLSISTSTKKEAGDE